MRLLRHKERLGYLFSVVTGLIFFPQQICKLVQVAFSTANDSSISNHGSVYLLALTDNEISSVGFSKLLRKIKACIVERLGHFSCNVLFQNLFLSLNKKKYLSIIMQFNSHYTSNY